MDIKNAHCSSSQVPVAWYQARGFAEYLGGRAQRALLRWFIWLWNIPRRGPADETIMKTS